MSDSKHFREMVHLGDFKVDSTKLLVGDPCYPLGTKGTYIANYVQDGIWSAYAQCADNRVERLMVLHRDCVSQLKFLSIDLEDVTAKLDVDSGLMAVQDLSVDMLYDDYLSVLEEDDFSSYGNIVNNSAVVCSSGWGDGTYPLYCFEDNKVIWGLAVDFT